MREHDARIAAGRQRRGNAGHDFEGDARLGQRTDFLRQAAENRGVATLKSDDDAPARANSIIRRLISSCGTIRSRPCRPKQQSSAPGGA